MPSETFNIDFLAIIFQVSINIVLILAFGAYICYTYSWEVNSKQEEEAEMQFREMRANLARKQAGN